MEVTTFSVMNIRPGNSLGGRANWVLKKKLALILLNFEALKRAACCVYGS